MYATNTLWVLLGAALVLFMTPGLALFYGGMVRVKNVLSVIIQNFYAMGIVTLIWAVFGFSLVYGPSVGGGIIGNLKYVALGKMSNGLAGFAHLNVSPSAVMIFQLMFAIITLALISGGVAERMKFSSFVVFGILWLLLVYIPIAHWVFSPEGWLAKRGVLDFAGGTVVEMNSGFSTLAVVLALGKRRGWPQEPMRPHSIPFSVLGGGILWFGWFGFNAGSALGVNSVAVNAFVNTQLAAAAGLIAWMIYENLKDKVVTPLGAVSGAVAGMVAITPAAGFVSPMSSILIGLAAGFICAAAVRVKYKFKYDDSLDVVAVHGVGGFLGMLLLGCLAEKVADPAGANGLFFGGTHFFLVELLAIAVTLVYVFGVTYIISKLVDKTIGLRVKETDEDRGLDIALHGESAYTTN
ncbi:MAG: ammonium transporter [Firmicutes bacterium]|jgi:Amt family ammonium transporter|nr:ammonium transporter [Bacillota bacterium]